ncbi:MAG TPA: hypothetical protein VE868_10180 [Balneolaceae bacterium]|nr:hypothetical protein [Balneolaceae bacterium]
MQDRITVSEHTSSAWKLILFASLFDTVVFFILFLLISDPLTVSIFRFLAFIGFAGIVLAGLQLQGRTKKIEIECDEEQIKITYYLSSRGNQEEIFELGTVDQITKQPAPRIWNLIPRKDSSKLQISFTDTSNKLSLLRFKGKDLYVTHSDAQKVVSFFKSRVSSS